MKNFTLEPITEEQVGKSTPLDLILVLIGIFPLTFNDDFIYFYTSYIFYSIVVITLGIFLFLMVIPKYSKRTFSLCYYICMFATLMNMSIWMIPKTSHYLLLKKETMCVKAKLQAKRYVHYSQSGIIAFIVEDNNTKRSLSELSLLDGIVESEYDQLPPTGSKIQICGELSKVGFSYAYIDTVP